MSCILDHSENAGKSRNIDGSQYEYDIDYHRQHVVT